MCLFVLSSTPKRPPLRMTEVAKNQLREILLIGPFKMEEDRTDTVRQLFSTSQNSNNHE